MADEAVTAYFHSAIYLADDGNQFVPEPWPSNILETCTIRAQVFLGPEPDPSSPGDGFDVIVYSPQSLSFIGFRKYLADGLDPEEPVTGTGFWFMPAWDREAFERAVTRICEEASPGPDWETVAMRIGIDIPWEFTYRYDIRAVPRPDWRQDF